MANTSLEMTFTNVADRKSTGNIQLDNAIARIYVAYKRGNGAMQDIAIELYNIKSKELYKVNGIEYFSDFAENVLKISKSKASRMCAVAKRFLICTEAEEEATREKYNKFNFTQLSEMLTADDEILEFINPEMTSKEIRDYINNAKRIGMNDQNNTDPDQNNNDQNNNDQNNTDPDQNNTDPDQTDNNQTDNNQTDNDQTDTFVSENEITEAKTIDDEKSVIADEYSIKVSTDNEILEATCKTLNGLKKIHTWLNKNKTMITTSFPIYFDVETENTETE
ncbi:MAG: hypothetical protein II453_21220 [Alphaproteobacteria bacterium]|nr:hypothetical protein [Alphaproteobacteria bacterium]